MNNVSSDKKFIHRNEYEPAVEACLKASAEDLSSEQVKLVVSTLWSYKIANITNEYPDYTKTMLIAAQRAWYLKPSERAAIERVFLCDSFRDYLPYDVEVETTSKSDSRVILANSLTLGLMSKYFEAANKPLMDGVALHEKWIKSGTGARKWKSDLATPFHRFQVKVSGVAIETVLGLLKDPEPTPRLAKHLLYLQPSEESAGKILSDRLISLKLASTLTGDNVLETYTKTMEYDSSSNSPYLKFFKDRCARFLMEGITIADEWDGICQTLPPSYAEDLLSRGLKRFVEMLRHEHLSDEQLFSGVTGGLVDVTPETCADLLVKRLPQKLHEVANIEPKKRKKKLAGLVNQVRSLVPGHRLEGPSEAMQWLKQFEKVVGHIARYDQLNIEGLTSQQLKWLLDRIAPHVTHLNLSGFAEEEDNFLWKNVFPQLEELTMADCSQLSQFSGTPTDLPLLRKMDLHNSPMLLQCASNQFLLERLDVQDCPSWVDYRSLSHMRKSLQWINVLGCNLEFTSSVITISDRKKTPMVVITDRPTPLS